MRQKKIIIGTRGSQLSLTQTNIVKNLLQPLFPNYIIETRIIKTLGDKNMKPIPLDTVGKGWFTKELDEAVMNGTVDLAVHSLKDIPETFPASLTITAIPQREDAREAFVSNNGASLFQLKKGAVIGTDSIRRKVQILHVRPDVIVKSLRGNVNRRLEKLDNGEYDAICLAVAGLKRLGLSNRITQYFAAEDFVPSPGQGALALVTNKTNKAFNKLLAQLSHQPSVLTTTAERIFSEIMEGGCSMPIGAYAKIKGKKITICGMVGSLDAKHMIRESVSGETSHYKSLAKKLAKNLLKNSAAWYKSTYVIVTRQSDTKDTFIKKLEKSGYHVFVSPIISIIDNEADPQVQKYLGKISSFDWIVFTSQNGVRIFMDAMQKRGSREKLRKIHFAAVGTKTAKAIETYGLKVSFIPAIFTGKDLAKEFSHLKGKNVLLPRADIANPLLVTQLEAKGAHVVDMPIYKTINVRFDLTKLEKLIHNNQILCLTFTSPSTVKGFVANFKNSLEKVNIFSLPVVSIGSVTTKAALSYGFTNVYTADTSTTDGMVKKLQESIIKIK